jgi:amino acid adenylation domain-containing protein
MSALITSNRTSETYPAAAPKSEGEASPAPARQTILSTQSVAELVAAQAVAAPDAVAITDGGRVMTYGELDRHANRLANHLITLGVGPETIVGLCLDRSPLSIISTLAVLKSGGAFLPLDPAYPVERLLFMLNDAQPSVVITVDSEAKNIPRGPWKVLSIDSDRTYENYSADAPATTFSSDQLAYVIYTSGSTGQPKGVEITHASLLNLIAWHRTEFAVTPTDRASHLASVGFDAAVWEVWPYLTAGASLHLPDATTRVSPEQLRDWLVKERITISFLPTALAEHVMALEWPAQTALRFLLTGADTLHRYPTSSLPFELANNYGPTECTVVATSGCVRSDIDAKGLPTIGRPIANTSIYILDENLREVPPGTEGELCIGGVGVARGYLNRHELTSEKFIADRFSLEPGARLYRTGDLARYLDNGEIAYLGRVDEQIKILGYRIEPAEVERVLNRHSAIDSSVVVARGDEKRLAAYLVIRNGSIPTALELRRLVTSELPEYMAPSIFVRLDRLPTTPNGKVDRTALPEPDLDNTLRDERFVAPRTAIEKRLATILSSLLNLNEVSVNDNFFMFGGHSLLGTQLLARIRNTFGVDLTLRALFESPTIAELGSEIENLIIARVENMSEEEALELLA